MTVEQLLAFTAFSPCSLEGATEAGGHLAKPATRLSTSGLVNGEMECRYDCFEIEPDQGLRLALRTCLLEHETARVLPAAYGVDGITAQAPALHDSLEVRVLGRDWPTARNCKLAQQVRGACQVLSRSAWLFRRRGTAAWKRF